MRNRYRSPLASITRRVVLIVFVAAGLFVAGYLTGLMSSDDTTTTERSVRVEAATAELSSALAAIDRGNLGIASIHLNAARGLVAARTTESGDADSALLRIASEISDARADLHDGHATRARERVLAIASSLNSEINLAPE